MENQRVLTCPNCGAATMNHDNCDYCGSLLVRFIDKGIEINQAAYGKDAKSHPGLKEVFEIMLSRINQGGMPICNVYSKNGGRLPFQLCCGDMTGGKTGVSLHVVYTTYSNEELQFKRSDTFLLFFSPDNGIEGFTDYQIDFGRDCDSAAKIASKLFVDYFKVAPNETLEFYLWDEDIEPPFYKNYRVGVSEPFHEVEELVFDKEEKRQQEEEYRQFEEEEKRREQIKQTSNTVVVIILFILCCLPLLLLLQGC